MENQGRGRSCFRRNKKKLVRIGEQKRGCRRLDREKKKEGLRNDYKRGGAIPTDLKNGAIVFRLGVSKLKWLAHG